MKDYSIRRLGPTDWEDYRKIRLEALAKLSHLFCPSRDEGKFSEADWKERLSNPNAAIFGLYHSSKVVGLSAIVRELNKPDAVRAHLVSSYIQEEHRGKGLSKLFFESRINWAKEQGDIRVLVLERRDDNVFSERAHRRYQFRLAGSREQKWPDGSNKPSLTFEMEI